MPFQKHRRTAKYTLVSLVATAADLSVFSALVFLEIPFYALATFMGLATGAVASWSLNRRWVFAESTVELRQQRLRYFNVTALSFFLNMVLMAVCVEFCGLTLMPSRVLTGILAWAVGYWINCRFVFEVKKS